MSAARAKTLADRPRSLLVATVAGFLAMQSLAGFGYPGIESHSEVDEPPSGYFSSEQAERGRQSYESACGECHSLTEFKGEDFEWRWRRQTAWDLFEVITDTMPEDRPGKLPGNEYVDIVAYFLQLNEYASGSRELTPDEGALSAVALGAGAAKSPSSE